ncbi:streptolysin S family TOMM toxin [Streptococcus suis]
MLKFKSNAMVTSTKASSVKVAPGACCCCCFKLSFRWG